MSVFKIEEKSSRTAPQVTVKRLDDKWKNFAGSTLPPQYVEKLESFKNFSVRPDDVFILGFPRSGTTRLQELVWIIANDFDFETLMEYDCDARIVFFETPEWSFQLRQKPLATII
ncbi:hypothetical protein ACKWTF_011356 [Chironomus riparius]